MDTGFSHDRLAERRGVREEKDREEERGRDEVDDEWMVEVGSRPMLVARRRREEEEEDREVVLAKTSLDDRGSMVEGRERKGRGGSWLMEGRRRGRSKEDRMAASEPLLSRSIDMYLLSDRPRV